MLSGIYHPSLILLAGEGLSSFFMALSGIMVARILSVEDFGRFTAILALAQILSFIVDSGMGPVVGRDIARGGSHQDMELDQIFSWRMALMGIACLLAPGIAWAVLRVDSSASLALVITPAVMCLGMADFLGWIFKGARHVKAYSAFMVFSRLSLVAACLIPFLFQKHSIRAVVLAYGMAGLLTFVSGLIGLAHFGFHLKITRWTSVFFRQVLPRLYSAGAALILAALFWRLDLMIVAHFCDPMQTGLFSSAGRLFDAIRLIPAALFGFYLPMFSSLHDRPDLLKVRLIRAFWLMLAVSAVLAFVGSAFAEPLCVILLGPAYKGSAPYFQLWMWCGTWVFINTVLLALLLACKDHRTPAVGIALALILDVLLDWIYVPRVGAMAAVWIRFSVDGINFLVLSYGVYKLGLWTTRPLLTEKPAPC